ncbi:MAG: phosphofurin acidic cluster sorting protein [Actinomycetota bacterium]|nr:phosphofurin acidic cluster sorting protein [Actinomycetota bacterium]
MPLPPQLILVLTAWMQGQILNALGQTCDIANVSAAGTAILTGVERH